jgi:hypothetical protein
MAATTLFPRMVHTDLQTALLPHAVTYSVGRPAKCLVIETVGRDENLLFRSARPSIGLNLLKLASMNRELVVTCQMAEHIAQGTRWNFA